MNTNAKFALQWLAFCALVIGAGIYVHNYAPRTADLAISTVLLSHDNGHGSGVHIGGGRIITAAHVVAERPTMEVSDDTGKERIGRIVWRDEAHDIALVQVDDFATLRMTQIVCAPRLVIGDELQAIGNPLGMKFIHTYGRVASVIAERKRWKVSVIADLLVAPGMSGGPVLDRSGGLVGIVTAGLSQGSSPLPLTLVVPSSAVCALMKANAA